MYACDLDAAPTSDVLGDLAEHGMQEFSGIMYSTGLAAKDVMDQLDELNQTGLLAQHPVRGCGETYFSLREDVLEGREVFSYLAEHGMQEFQGIMYQTGLDASATMHQLDALNQAGFIERTQLKGTGGTYFSLADDVPDTVVRYLERTAPDA